MVRVYCPTDLKYFCICLCWADLIRPDWQAKLAAAEAATTRRANRRIIMRQVGDRLIPVGVSSSRLGSELPAGSTAGPGGAIIIGENTRWGTGLIGSVAGGARERRSSRRELTQLLQGLGDGSTDMEEVGPSCATMTPDV
jgi:hypothetical protein